MIFLILWGVAILATCFWGFKNVQAARRKEKADRELHAEIDRLLSVDWDENSYA